MFAALSYGFTRLSYQARRGLPNQIIAATPKMALTRLTVILSDGDVVFQPRKFQRSGIWDAVLGRALIYIHTEQTLADMEQC